MGDQKKNYKGEWLSDSHCINQLVKNQQGYKLNKLLSQIYCYEENKQGMGFPKVFIQSS